MSDTLAILSLIVREALSAPRVGRRPEPDTVMEDPESVESFHAEGSAGGALLPVYHFNALATSRLLPRGGTLVDLGSGSGQYLAYLAQCRPDIEIFGLDLSEAMVSHGNRALGAAGLGDRVHLRVADMTNFSGQAPEHTDGLSSVFALHHLPTRDHLQRCLGEVMRVRRRDGCGVWLFDHARPRHPRTPALFPEIFTPDASAIFRQDSRNSLIASFSFAELRECLDAAAAEPC
jgi:arsenite methyltransferase